MKVQFRQSGGFAGLLKGTDLDTEDLPSEEVQKLSSLADLLTRAELDAQADLPPQATDSEQMTVVVSDGRHERRVSFSKTRVPQGLQPALDYLASKSIYLKR